MKESTWQRCIEKKWVRGLLLLGFAVFGWAVLYFHTPNDKTLNTFTSDWSSWVERIKYYIPPIYESDKPRAYKYFMQLVATLPIFLLLWYFRTYDTRQQIERTTAQLQQGNFLSGMDKIVSDELLTVNIGVKMLLETSKISNVFDEQIRLAFIRRIQQLRGKLGEEQQKYKNAKRERNDSLLTGTRFSILDDEIPYTKHIWKWLVTHSKSGDAIEFGDAGFMYTEVWDIFAGQKSHRNLMGTLSLNEMREVLEIVERKEIEQCPY